MNKKILIGSIIAVAVILLPSTIAIPELSSENKDLNVNNNVYVEPNKCLTSYHIRYLKKALPFIQDSEKRQIIFDIVNEINERGYVESIDIQRIVEKYDTDITSANILSKIKTTGHSGNCDGYVFCFPGLIRSIFEGFLLPRPLAVIYAKYSHVDSWADFGWHFTINGEGVSKGRGQIIGYVGRIRLSAFPAPPDWYFMLDGSAVLIFHNA